MKIVTKVAAGAAFVIAGAMSPAMADECTFDKAKDDFEQADIDQLYSCLKDKLAEGYGAQGHEVGSVYRDWQVAATGAAAPGPHGNRFLLTFANETAFAQYVKYNEDGGFSMPVGSVLAKESFTLSKKQKPRRGPLLIMTKVAAGEADEFGNWVYSGVNGKGKAMKVKQSFCHDCHVAYEDQDSMGYPDSDVRLETN
jgi:hypothetical protein